MAVHKYDVEDLGKKLLDPLLSDNYLFTLTNLPDGIGADAENTLALYCQQVNKPAETIEPVPVGLHGHEFQFAGRNTVTHDLTINFVENYKMEITRILEKWTEKTRSHFTQTGELKASYARTQGVLRVLTPMGDSDGTPTYTIYGVWPTSIPEIQFEGSASQLIQLSVTFKFDYYKEGAVGGA